MLLSATALTILLCASTAFAATITYRSGLLYDGSSLAPPVPVMGLNYVQLRLDQPGHLDYTVNYLGVITFA